MEGDHGDHVEDPDFVHSEVDIGSEEDGLLYDRNVTDEIEIGPDMTEVRKLSLGEVGDDDLEYPSSEELVLACSSDEEVGYRFPEFLAETDMTCSICGLTGHNKRYHSSNGAPVHDWYDAELEPVASNSNIAVDEHGKMVSARRDGLSSTQNPSEEEPMRFIPTPK